MFKGIMPNVFGLWMVLSVIALETGCDKADSKSSAGASATELTPIWDPKPGYGCIQGAVIDAYTGEKINLGASAEQVQQSQHVATENVFALIRGQKFNAMSVEYGKNPLLKGEYYICDIPIEQEYLLFAHFDGYLPFQSSKKIESTVAQRSSRASEDIVKPDPIALANLCLFPKGAETKDLAVKVYNQGKPVTDAIVRLKPSHSNNALEMDDLGGGSPGFGCLTPSDSRLVALRNLTDKDGQAVFSAKDLVLGAVYTPYIIPTGSSHLQPIIGASFTLGVNHASIGSAKDFYEVVVDLDTTRLPLELVSCSNSEIDHRTQGELKLVFNQEIRMADIDDLLQADVLVDCENESRGPDAGADPFCSLSNVDLSTDVPGNNRTEALSISVNGNSLTMKPNWRVGATPSQSKDPGLYVTYPFDKLKVRVPSGQSQDMTTVTISSINNIGCNAKVYFYPYQ